jgi:hypothetical protein
MFDIETGYSWDEGTALWWIHSNEHVLGEFLWSEWNPHDHDVIMERMLKYPVMTKRIMEDWMESDKRKVEKIVNDLANSEGLVVLTLGGRGKGKTATATFLAERVAEEGKSVCVVVDPTQPYPPFAKPVMRPQDTPENSLVIVDEAAVRYSSRTSMWGDQRRTLNTLFTLRHTGRNFLYICQSSADVDSRVIRQMDRLIIKPQTQFAQEYERKPLVQLIGMLAPKSPLGTLYYSDYWHVMVKHTPLAKCWTEELSKPFRMVRSQDDAIQIAKVMLEDGCSINEIMQHMSARSFDKPEWWWAEKLFPVEQQGVDETGEMKETKKETKIEEKREGKRNVFY